MTAASRVALQLYYPRSMTATAFDNLDDYLALPRVSGMAVSADGPRVVTTVAEFNDKIPDKSPQCGKSTRRAGHPRAD